MGQYINVIKGKHIGVSAQQKSSGILDAGGIEIPTPTEWKEGLVCVVDNGFIGAAGYAYNEQEMGEFKNISGRPSKWFLLKDAKSFID